jgi:hypothetical protein
MAELDRSPLERRADSYVERRYHSVDREPRFHRFAGELFGVSLKERIEQNQKEARQRLQKERPTGVGFGEKDNYGPDDSWSSQEPVKHTPAPGYYKAYKSF